MKTKLIAKMKLLPFQAAQAVRLLPVLAYRNALGQWRRNRRDAATKSLTNKKKKTTSHSLEIHKSLLFNSYSNSPRMAHALHYSGGQQSACWWKPYENSI